MNGHAFLCRHSFSHKIVAYDVLFISQHRLSYRGIIYYVHVVAVNIAWDLNRYTNNPLFVLKAVKDLHLVFHLKKIHLQTSRFPKLDAS